MQAPYKMPSGFYVDLENPVREHIALQDIAWNLAGICRFGGSTKEHYSVAQHCVDMDSLLLRSINEGVNIWDTDVQSLLSQAASDLALRKRLRMEVLLHDASEAYLGDIPSPLKKLIPEYQKIEREWTDVIRSAFNLPPMDQPEDQAIHQVVRCLDHLALHIERRWVQRSDAEECPANAWGDESPEVSNLAQRWLSSMANNFWSRDEARRAFEARYRIIQK
ncbi:MAG: hypothetical protein IBX50_14695 [Marinospirillum sp.]|uniref:hypothetical protein n=1 Tax=Marinospirillum sp. TaxID=2183934 RepID=UPI0019E8B8DD|nr:hypothetical protein [Marinospirillum sp.]MBE0507937.1 hypothetical protein [Marinospirillum sp.]